MAFHLQSTGKDDVKRDRIGTRKPRVRFINDRNPFRFALVAFISLVLWRKLRVSRAVLDRDVAMVLSALDWTAWRHFVSARARTRSRASGLVVSEPCVSHWRMVSKEVRWEAEIVRRKTAIPILLASIAADPLPVGSSHWCSGCSSMCQPSTARAAELVRNCLATWRMRVKIRPWPGLCCLPVRRLGPDRFRKLRILCRPRPHRTCAARAGPTVYRSHVRRFGMGARCGVR